MRKLILTAALLAAPLTIVACSPSPPPQRATVAPGQAVVVPPGSTVKTCPPGTTSC